MTEKTAARIGELVRENLRLRAVNENNERRMKENRRELGRLLISEGDVRFETEEAVVKLVCETHTFDWSYIKALPGFNMKKAHPKIKCTPFASITKHP